MNPLADPNSFAPLLQESTRRFVADYANGVSDFSNFTSIFSRLIHSVADPPLELLWFYSAVIFHGERQRLAPPRVSAVKDLFQLLVSCSASGDAAKRIAALAPVVYELCNLAAEKEHFEREEIERLLEGMISYFSICCMDIRDGSGGDHCLSLCFSEVVRAWMVDRAGVGVGDELEAFLPIVGNVVRERIKIVGSCGIGYLAGVVMCEAFMLRLCFKFGTEFSRAELKRDVRSCAVQMVTGFRCFSFFDSLLMMLMEPVLPVAKMLNYQDECLLLEVIYDSVIMVDYTFFKHMLELKLPSESLKNLAVTWLIVAENAIRFIRTCDNQTKVISYASAVSKSCLASHLIDWIINQTGMERQIVSPKILTPVSLIKWMLFVEDQGVRVFDCEFTKVRAKGVICQSRVDYMLPRARINGEAADGSDLEMVDSVDTSAIGVRKRKGTDDEMEIQVKFFKYQFHESSAKENVPSSVTDDGLSNEMLFI